eukprot:7166271-Karenia_brevis.AAC.1
MYLAIDQLRHSQAYKSLKGMPDTTIVTQPPQYIQQDKATPLQFKINSNFYQYHYRKAPPVIKGFLTLLTHNNFAPATTMTAGLTWLELLILSTAASPDRRATELPRTARSNQCLGRQIHNLKTQAMRLVPLLLDRPNQQLFKSCKTTDNRLQGLGFLQTLPHTSCQLAIDTTTIKSIHKVLLTIHAPLTRLQLNHYNNNTLRVPIKRLSHKGSPKW